MHNDNDPRAAQRRRALRTALVLGGVVGVIYLGFILSGVLGSG